MYICTRYLPHVCMHACCGSSARAVHAMDFALLISTDKGGELLDLEKGWAFEPQITQRIDMCHANAAHMERGKQRFRVLQNCSNKKRRVRLG